MHIRIIDENYFIFALFENNLMQFEKHIYFLFLQQQDMSPDI